MQFIFGMMLGGTLGALVMALLCGSKEDKKDTNDSI